MTTKIDPATLQTLHRILKQKTDLNDRIRRGPRQTEAAVAALETTSQALETAKQELTKLRMASDEKQLQLKSREAKIEDLKGKRNSCDSNREFQLLNDQIAADEAANLVLSDEILELLEKIEQQEIHVQQCQQKLTAVEKEVDRIKTEVESQLDVLESDMALVEKELEETESNLPGAIKLEYRRLVEANGEDALAVLEDKCCGNCYTTQSPLVVDQLRMKQIITCGSCGSILYFPQGDSVTS